MSLRGGATLRGLVGSGKTVESALAHDALSARLIERAGFEAVVVGGGSVANFAFGLPDIALVSIPEVLVEVAHITAAVDIPVLVDLDDGGSTPMHVTRNVRLAEAAGAAAVMIEDITAEKHLWTEGAGGWSFQDDRLHPVETTVAAVRAALDARRDPDTVVVARTLAYPIEGMDEALRRAKAFAAAGADMVNISRIPSDLVSSSLVDSVGAPVVLMPLGLPSGEDRQRFEEAGVALVHFYAAPMLAAVQAFDATLDDIRARREVRVPDMRVLLETVDARGWTALLTGGVDARGEAIATASIELED